MRISLIIKTIKSGENSIPVNYSYPLSAWIYHTISGGNHEFARFLHDTGFQTGIKPYKLFTFSKLLFPPKGFKVEDDRLSILMGECRLILSFMAPLALENFITGLFKGQEFLLGDSISRTLLRVESIEIMPPPVLMRTTRLHCLSPILVSKERPGSRNAEYLSPGHPDYTGILTGNLINKFTAALSHGLIDAPPSVSSNSAEISLKILNTPKSWLSVIKAGTPQQSKLKGFTFDFEITGPEELIQTGYAAGFGEKNALGMGCVQIM